VAVRDRRRRVGEVRVVEIRPGWSAAPRAGSSAGPRARPRPAAGAGARAAAGAARHDDAGAAAGAARHDNARAAPRSAGPRPGPYDNDAGVPTGAAVRNEGQGTTPPGAGPPAPAGGA